MTAMTATHAANHVATDPFLLVFGTAAIYALVLAVQTRQRYWWAIAGVGYGLAILSKGVAAAPFGLFVLPYLVARRAQWNGTQFGTMVAAGLVVVLPWFLAASVFAPSELVYQMFQRQIIGRATGQAYVTHEATFGFMRYPYFREAPGYFAPTGYLVPVSLFLTVAHYAQSGQFRDVEVLCWPLCVGTIALYAVVGGNHIWYILPAAVPISILAADGVERLLTAVLDVAVTRLALYSTDRRSKQYGDQN
jgi:4-amino-4-deoxy-L-arabinose transferase-like glycosyltransferase